MSIVNDTEPLLLFDNETLLVRVNPEGENFGILREMLGDRWFFDCESCDVGSRGYLSLSELVKAINEHKLARH